MRLPRCRCERWLAALLALTLLAACGGGTAPAPAPSPTAATPTPTAPLPTPAALSAADIAATAASTGCQMTPYSSNVDVPELDGSPAWELDGLTLAPSPDWGGRWYAGTMAVFLASATEGTVTLSGARLDGPGAPLSLTQAVDVGLFGADMRISAPGCWQLRAELPGKAPLEVTLYAEPAETRPDIAQRVRERAARIPYPPPASCAVTPATGPTLRNNTRHPDDLVYTIHGAGQALQGDPGQLFEGVNELRWFPDPFASVSINGQLLDDPSVTVRADLQRSADFDGEYFVATTVFPTPGCWQLRGVSGVHTLEVIVYVYPAACAPNDDGATRSDACRPPECARCARTACAAPAGYAGRHMVSRAAVQGCCWSMATPRNTSPRCRAGRGRRAAAGSPSASC